MEWNAMSRLTRLAQCGFAIQDKPNNAQPSSRFHIISPSYLTQPLLHFASGKDGYYIAAPSFHRISSLFTPLQFQYQILTLIQPPMASSNPKSKPKTKQPHNEPPSVSANFAKSSTSASSSIIDYDHEIYLQLTTSGSNTESSSAKTPNQVYREVCI